MIPRKGGVAERRGIKCSGNPTFKDYCEDRDTQPLTAHQMEDDVERSRDSGPTVLDAPGRFRVDSLS